MCESVCVGAPSFLYALHKHARKIDNTRLVSVCNRKMSELCIAVVGKQLSSYCQDSWEERTGKTIVSQPLVVLKNGVRLSIYALR